MSSQSLGFQISVLLLTMAILSGVETAIPLYSRFQSAARIRVNLLLTSLVLGFNWIGSTLAALLVVGARWRSFGLLPLLELPLFLEVLIGVVLLDLCTYVAHIAMHRVPILWRFHRVHHSDPFVDVTTSYRFHPFESLWRALWTFVPALLLGVPLQGVVVYRLLSALNGLLEHANIAVPRRVDQVASLLLVTSNMHKIHHSNEVRHTESNFGNILALYDRVFGTFAPTKEGFEVSYGLKPLDAGSLESFRTLLLLPVRRPSAPTLRAVGDETSRT